MAFLKCATCGQLYTSKIKLAEHISSRHSEKEEEQNVTPKRVIVKDEPSPSKPLSAAEKYAALSSRYASLANNSKAVAASEPKKASPFAVPTISNNGFCSASATFPCSFCGKAVFQTKMPRHVITQHLDELRKYVEESASIPSARDRMKSPVYESEIEADIAYILGEDQPEEPSYSYAPRYVCPCCGRQIGGSYRAFVFHVERRHISLYTGTHQCQLCLKLFRGRIFHRLHAKYPHPFSCPKCSLTFSSRHALVMHDRHDHRFKCEIAHCRDGREHEHVNLPKCRYCFMDRFFHTEEQLQIHINSRHMRNGQLCLQCRRCPRKFSSLEAYLDHRRSVHFGCKHPGCTFQSATAVGLANHERNHLKPFCCVRCQKSFKSRENYHSHCRRFHKIVKGAKMQPFLKAEPVYCNCSVKDEPQ